MPLRKLLLLVPLLVCTACMQSRHDMQEYVLPGMALPTFRVTLSDGSIYNTQQPDGRPTLLLFFSTTCPDCQRALPVVQTFYERYAQPHAIRVAAIGREEAPATVHTYWTTHGYTIPFSPQPDRTIYSLFATQGIPRLYAIDARGIVTHSIPTPTTLTLEQLISCFEKTDR